MININVTLCKVSLMLTNVVEMMAELIIFGFVPRFPFRPRAQVLLL